MPIPSLAADLAYVLTDVGVSVVYGTERTNGKLRRTPIEEFLDGGLTKVASKITLIIADGAITNPTVDASITIDGVAFKIRDAGERLPDTTRHLAVVEA